MVIDRGRIRPGVIRFHHSIPCRFETETNTPHTATQLNSRMLRFGENNWPSGITAGDARGHHQAPILLLFFQMKCDSRPCRGRVGRLGVGNSPEPITTARPTGKVVSRPQDPGSSPTGSRNVSLVRRQAAFSRPPSVARLFHHRPSVEIPHRLWLHPPTPCWQVADRRTGEAKSPDRVEGLAAGRHARERYAEPFGHLELRRGHSCRSHLGT